MPARKTTPKTKTKTKTTAPKMQFYYFDPHNVMNFNVHGLEDTEGHINGPFASIAALQADIDKNFEGVEAEIEVLTVHARFKIDTKTIFTEIL